MMRRYDQEDRFDVNGRNVPKDVTKRQANLRDGEELSVADRTWVHPQSGMEYVFEYPFRQFDQEADMREAYVRFEEGLRNSEFSRGESSGRLHGRRTYSKLNSWNHETGCLHCWIRYLQNMTNPMQVSEEDLLDAVQSRAQEIKVEKLSFSVRELGSMLREGQIEIQPEFQRMFRWTLRQKSSLIESMLLSIPVPAIFVAADKEGKWDVVDGVQRLSTIFSYMGIPLSVGNEQSNISDSNGSSDAGHEVPDPEVDWDFDSAGIDDHSSGSDDYGEFRLRHLEHLKEAEGLSWSELPIALQRKIQQTRIDVTILERSSTPSAKYNLFLRLNSGSILSAQELRNAMLVMIDREFFYRMKSLSANSEFKAITNVSKRKQEQAFQDELVLRFFMQDDYSGGSRSLNQDFGEVLTEWAKKAAMDNVKRGKTLDEQKFLQTVDLVYSEGGRDVLRRPGKGSNSRQGPVSNAAFEFVMSGVAGNLKFLTNNRNVLKRRLSDFWESPLFADHVGSGVNARDRFPMLVNNGRRYFAESN